MDRRGQLCSTAYDFPFFKQNEKGCICVQYIDRLYVQVAQTLVSGLNFELSEEIRSVAASGIYTSTFLDKEGRILQVKTNAQERLQIS